MPSNLSLCPNCGGDPILYREVNHNGANVITARCSRCGNMTNRKQPYLPKSEHPNWEQYPLYRDNTINGHKCEVSGCDRKDTEWHHFAPIALFGTEADDYPGAYLCQYHHDHWHEITKTGKWTKRKVEA